VRPTNNALLPLTATLEDYAGTEKISYLPRKLSTAASKHCRCPARSKRRLSASS